MSRRTRRATGPEAVGRRIVELAIRAPSVHNTQPWAWRIEEDVLELYADRRRQLMLADASGRNLTISCGAALHHAQVAAAASGYLAETRRMPDPTDPDHLATLRLVQGPRTSEAAAALRALELRRTDRRRFTAWPIPDDRLERLAAVVTDDDVCVVPLTDVSARFRAELLVARAMVEQNGDRRYAEEERRWIEHSRVDGVPETALPPADPGGQRRRSRFGADPSLVSSHNLVESSDGLLVIGTDSDDPLDWLRAGESLSRLWLQATVDELSVVPLSQVIEVDETRLALRHEVLDGSLSPHILVRIGWQEIGRSDLPRSPRRPLGAVLIG